LSFDISIDNKGNTDKNTTPDGFVYDASNWVVQINKTYVKGYIHIHTLRLHILL
jgi:hypothetical protein